MDEGPLESLLTAAVGDEAAREKLFATLYQELHRVAARELRRSGTAHAMSPTTLLHEAYLDMAGREGTSFPDQARFIAYAARAMRGLVIDFARERRAQKRGGSFQITRLATAAGDGMAEPVEDLSRLSEALDELAKADCALAELVDLKYFCGFSFTEIAAMRSVSERTVQREWQKARLLLFQSLKGSMPD